MKITVFEQANEGMIDSDFQPQVYEGHLSERRIRQVVVELGGVGTGGYAGYALAELEEHCWLAVYANEGRLEEAEDNKDPETGLFRFEDRGHLTVQVTYQTTN